MVSLTEYRLLPFLTHWGRIVATGRFQRVDVEGEATGSSRGMQILGVNRGLGRDAVKKW
jgi:hypothetical protein